jgi:hypothetical protein
MFHSEGVLLKRVHVPPPLCVKASQNPISKE